MTDPIDTKARELLDKALRDLGLHEDAYHVGCGADLDRNDQAAVNAISAALRSAPEGYNMPCGKCRSGVYDAAALAAFDGVIPKCERHDRLCVGAVHAMQANRQPEGYVLVPVEPTDEMAWAPCDVEVGYPTWAGSREGCTTDEAKAIWAAMIAARPGEGA